MFACTDVTQSDTSSTPEPIPLLTLTELLNADDVKQGLAQASRNDDQQAIKQWQQRLLAAADEVNLVDTEVNMLIGDQGLVFLKFQGLKTNYQQDFERAFFEFGDVQAVYDRYPAFQSLQQQSKDLVQKRDALIDSLANQYIAQGVPAASAIEQARDQWQNMMQAPQRDSM